MTIVSLVPSITKTLFDFGLSAKEIAGRTKFCIHPAAAVYEIPVIGGTKNIHIEKIKALKPDLIIANKEENVKEQAEALMKDFNVWVTDIKNMEDNRQFITDLGSVLGKENRAAEFNSELDAIFEQPSVLPGKKAAYLIWQNPLMTVGGDTFIHDILVRTGFENIFGHRTRYPEIGVQELAGAEYILLSTEPYPFRDQHVKEFGKKFPESKITLADGEAFSWFGTHLLQCKPTYNTLRNL